MRSRIKPTLWRFILRLLILTLVLAPFAGPAARAAPVFQEDEPEAVSAPGDHLVTGFILNSDSPNIVRTNVQISVNFSYSTNQVGGVLIFVRPFTNGALSPGYSAHPSPTYPTSATGKGSGWFTILSGTTEVDEIRVQMKDASNTVVLFEVFLPVYYLFSDSAHIVTGISFLPDTPNALKFGQNVDIPFSYITRQSGGVRIFFRPFTNGEPTPNYGAHGSGVYPIGSGSGSGFFTINSGQVVVDQVHVQMTNADQTILLFEAFLPVYFRFRSPNHIVTHIELNPDSPNVFQYGQSVNLSFNYTTNHAAGVRIWARPFSGANLSPSFGGHGSTIHPSGSGAASGSFTLNAGPMVVDKVRIQMWTADTNILLFETFLPVYLKWAGAGPPPGPDMQITRVEVTQAIQDLNNSVDLVAGKRTYVRVHVNSPTNSPDVFATLSGKHGFVSLTPVLNPGNPGSDIMVRTSPDRGQINDSFWFELPSSWTTAGNLTLTARLDPNNAKNDLNQTNNVRSVIVNFKSTPPLRLRIFNVQYTASGSTYMAATSHLDSLESWLRRAYPISSLQVTRQTFVYPTNGLPNVDELHVWLALAKILRILFSGEDGRTVYYGVVDDGGGFMRGKAADIPSTIAAGPSGSDDWGWDYDGSYNDWYGGHEIGHTRGRYHAEYCGAADGSAYPYATGRISPDLTGNGAIYGFDITTRAIYGPNWKDVMTYCDNQWVSDFTYEGIRSYLVGVGLQSAEPAVVEAAQFLVVAGMADLETDTANLQAVYLINQTNTLPLPEAGEWTIALVNAANSDVAVHPFSPDQLTDAEESPGTPAVIAEVVPWVSGAVRIEIRHNGQVKASRSASANAPGVNLNAPAPGSTIPAGAFEVNWTGSDPDGNALSYSVLYSNDDGETWQILAAELETTSLVLNTNQLPGGTGMLRVIASDGFLSAQDTHGALAMPLNAPAAQILMPTPNQIFFPTQQVSFLGTAYDMEDGTLEDAAFQWSSSIDGVIGTGASLNTAELTTGVHVITMQVTDSNGMSTQVQRTITVAVEGSLEVVNLNAAPFAVNMTAPFQGAPVQETLTLRTTGESEITWTASVNVGWLQVSTTSGTTPSDLTLTFNPAGLSVGSHTGKITFSSGQAGNSPMEIFVTFQVAGEALYLPLLRR